MTGATERPTDSQPNSVHSLLDVDVAFNTRGLDAVGAVCQRRCAPGCSGCSRSRRRRQVPTLRRGAALIKPEISPRERLSSITTGPSCRGGASSWQAAWP